MLRRTKREVASQLHLPPCTRVDVVVELSRQEKEQYDKVVEGFRTKLAVRRNSLARAAPGSTACCPGRHPGRRPAPPRPA
jgi:SNF2 family DNA or RNA helicase